MSDTFLRQQARSQHFTLGAPRQIIPSEDGSVVFFVRSQGPFDARGCLWRIDVSAGADEQLLVDPLHLAEEKDVPLAERQRRERARESATGIVSYSIDRSGNKAAFVINGDIYVVECGAIPRVECLVSGRGAFDAQISPDGSHVAYVSQGSLQVVAAKTQAVPTVLASEDEESVYWGIADFIAAEEIGRMRGFWWSPDSKQILVTQVDERHVQEWHLANPAQPETAPQKIRYPVAGSKNAITSLFLMTLDGKRRRVQWDATAYEYLIDAHWSPQGLLITVQSRSQKEAQLLDVSVKSGRTSLRRTLTNAQWLELTPGFPRQLPDGALLYVKDKARTRSMYIDDKAVTPTPLIIRSLCGILSDGSIIFTAWGASPREWHVWHYSAKGKLERLTTEGGIHEAVARGLTCVIKRSDLKGVSSTTLYEYKNNDWNELESIKSLATKPLLHPAPRFYQTTSRKLESALVLPEKHSSASLPVLLMPYGGPGAQLVVNSLRAYNDAQWWANQGFAVVITDNRGMLGRGPAWEKEIAHDLIGPVLEDQIAALHGIADKHTELDLKRVGIRGWSFGGYLAAYAVVRHPEVFQAAVAGAPVTDWRLYDTHYTERYLGDPQDHPRIYDHNSLLKEAGKLARPLMIIHGFADDNVVVANSLKLSGALLEAGLPHQVLPLSGVTHMASQEVVAENIEKLQLAFFKEHLIRL